MVQRCRCTGCDGSRFTARALWSVSRSSSGSDGRCEIPRAGADVRISVVIVTVGTSRVLERGLAAVVRGSRRPDELVLVDPAPEPSTTGLAEHIPVRIHRAPALGVSRARNLGASLTSGDYLAFTDDDCLPDEGW